MGLYAVDCPQCLKPFLWFSGNSDQRCDDCKEMDAAKEAIRIVEDPPIAVVGELDE